MPNLKKISTPLLILSLGVFSLALYSAGCGSDDTTTPGTGGAGGHGSGGAAGGHGGSATGGSAGGTAG
ncbi:MAG TPA: hypothetical protein VGP07_04240, partial [Polyangia bacterium]